MESVLCGGAGWAARVICIVVARKWCVVCGRCLFRGINIMRLTGYGTCQCR